MNDINRNAVVRVFFDSPSIAINFLTHDDVTIVTRNGVPSKIIGDYEDYDLSKLIKAGVKLDKVDLSAFSNLSMQQQNDSLEALAAKINEFTKQLNESSKSE